VIKETLIARVRDLFYMYNKGNKKFHVSKKENLNVTPKENQKEKK
jgi:hypothetical protein